MQLIKASTGEVAGRAEEQELALLDEKFHFTAVGLIVRGDPTFEEWEECGQLLRHIQRRVHFWIGDWLNYGERRWGEKYAQAIDETHFNYQTLADDKWVTSRVQFSSRKENLSFSHHKAVAPLEPAEQEKWLNWAEKEDLTSTELRQQIKASKDPPNSEPEQKETVEVTINVVFTVPVSLKSKLRDAIEKWIASAAKIGMECKSFDVSEVE